MEILGSRFDPPFFDSICHHFRFDSLAVRRLGEADSANLYNAPIHFVATTVAKSLGIRWFAAHQPSSGKSKLWRRVADAL